MTIIFKYYYRTFIFMAVSAGMLSAQTQSQTNISIQQVIDLRSFPVEIKKPGSIAVSLYGDIFITDQGNHYLIKTGAQGEYINHTGGFGWKDGQLDSPRDVSTFDGLNIYVADFQNRRIQRYNRKLQYISSLGESSENRLSYESKIKMITDIGYPAALSISPLGDLFCINQEKNQVIKINSSGSMNAAFGGFESGKGQLTIPSRIKVTRERVYVLDQSRIVMYDYFGNYLGELSHQLLKKPADIDIDQFDRIYIAETNPPFIMVMNSNGHMITQISDYEFIMPAGIALSGNKLYVLDSGLLQIIVFQITESR